MRSRIVPVACILFTLLVTGCATTPRPVSNLVGIDAKHSNVWPGMAEVLTSNGYKVVSLTSLNDAALQKIGVLLVIGPTSSFNRHEVTAIERFVSSGGGLVVAGQAWSWTYKEYGNEPVITYPLNIIGRKLDFQITGNNIGAPTFYRTDIMAGIGGVERSDWWPSEVVLTGKSAKPIIQDEKNRTIAALQSFGRGRIVVFGHDHLLKENPKVLNQSLDYAIGME